MSDALPRLLPDDPQNLLSVEARKRIQRARLKAQKLILETEVSIEARFDQLDWDSREVNSLRGKARFKNAKAALFVYHSELSRLNIPAQTFRKYMKGEIEAASNSLQLTQAQQQLLELEFFYPEEKAAQSQPPTIPEVPAIPVAPMPAKAVPEARRAFVIPLLDAKGWSILDWALEAEVAHATAMDYLDNKTAPFRSTRLKLAKALGVPVERLPR